jgi:serine/threonine protein kinase
MGLEIDKRATQPDPPAGDGVVHEEGTDKGIGPVSSVADAAPPEPRAAPSKPATALAPHTNFSATLMGIAPPEGLKISASGEPVAATAREAREALAPGALFMGAYRIVRATPDDAGGDLYEAEQVSVARPCSLRILDRPGVPTAARARFVADAKAAAKAAVDQVLAVYGAGHDDESGRFWLATETSRGESLAARLARLGVGEAMPVDEAWAIIGQICHALSQAHEHGVVHRDLRPANVRLEPGGGRPAVKLLGFGVAHLHDPVRDEGRMFARAGAPLWMAPEQVVENDALTPAADVWAAGLLAFRMLTGWSYWLVANGGEIDLSELLSELIAEPRKAASARALEFGRPGALVDGFDAWFAKCVARDPAQRFVNGAALARALAEFAPLAAGVSVLDYEGSPSRPTIPAEHHRVETRPAPAIVGAHVISADRETLEPATVVRMAAINPMEAKTTPRLDAHSFEEMPTMRMRQLAPLDEHGAAAIAPAIAAAAAPLQSNLPPVMPQMPPPAAPTRPPPRKRPWATVIASFAMGAACVYAVHLAAGPDGLPGLFRSPTAVPARPFDPNAPDPALTAAGGAQGAEGEPASWPADATRVWGATLTNDTSLLSCVMVLRLNASGHASGYISWTIVRLAGAVAGEQVRESVEGSYEPTLGVLELHGVLSTNPVVLPVNAYRLRVRASGVIDGQTTDGMSRIAGTLRSADGGAQPR